MSIPGLMPAARDLPFDVSHGRVRYACGLPVTALTSAFANLNGRFGESRKTATGRYLHFVSP